MMDPLILASMWDISEMLDKSVKWTGSWLPMTILATMTVILFNIIFLMLSRAFHMEELERYAKSEMLQAGATLIMAVFLVTILYEATDSAFLTAIFGQGTATCQGDELKLFEGSFGMSGALELIKCRISERAKVLADVLAYAMADHSADFDLLTLSISLMGLPVFTGNYVSSWYYKVEQYRLLAQFSANLLVSTNAQIALVNYVDKNMLRMFLPLGIILRGIPFTRSMGAFFMSIAIGLYFIFPIVFMVTDPTFVKAPSAPSVPSSVTKRADFCYPTFSGAVALVQSAGSTGSGGSAGGYGMDTSRAVDAVSKAYAGMLLHPFLALSITLVFVRYLMYVLGGEPYDVMRLVAKVV